MHPVLFMVMGFPVRAYGVMAALGFLAAVGTWIWLGKKDGEFAAETATDLGVWLMLSGILGARIAYVIANWGYYRAVPGEIVRIDQGGLIFYGGLILASAALVVFAWRRRIPLWKMADYAITGLVVGHALGRIGCFLNGCCYGRAATAHPAWGVVYPACSEPGRVFAGVPLYPVQLLEAAGLLAIWAVLLRAYPRRKRAGEVFALYLLLYPPLRFALEYLRGDPRQGAWNVDAAQWISIGLWACGWALMAFLPKRKPDVNGARGA